MKLTQLWIAIVWLGGGVFGCADGDSTAAPDSPTGTTLSPREGLGDVGYDVLDEVCDSPDSPAYMQRFVTPMFRDITIIDHTAFLVDGSLLWAVDIADPYAPKRLSLTRLPGTPKSLAALDTTVYAANGRGEILVIDGADPTAPQVSTALSNLPGISLDVAVADGILYIAAGEGGLVTADLSDANGPELLGRAAIPGFAAATAVEGDFAYVAACTHAAVVEVSDPASPTFVSATSVPEGHAREAAVEDGRLLLSGGEALFLADVRTPTAPEIVSYYTDYDADGFYVNAAAVRNGIAYIAAGDESFRAVDILRMAPIAGYISASNREAMRETEVAIDPPGTVFTVSSDPIGIAVKGDRLFVLGNFRWVGERLLRILDISSPYAEPVDLGRYTQPKTLTGVDVFDDVVVTHQADGQTVVSDLDGKERTRLTLPAPVHKAAVGDARAHLLLANGDVVRTSDFETYTRIAEDAADVAASSTTVFVADPLHNRLRSETAEAPFSAISGELTVENAFLGFARIHAAGTRVYAYDWALGELHVARRRSDGALEETGSLYIGECEAYDIADYFSGQDLDEVRTAGTADGFAMLCPFDAFGAPSVLGVDLQDPDAPVIADRIELPVGRYRDFEVTDDAVYTVGFDNNGYRSTIRRITDGDRLEVAMDGAAVGLAVKGDDLFVADQDFGLRHFRFQDNAITPVDADTALAKEN